MKKLIALLLCLVICLSFAGCQKPETQGEKPTKQTEKPAEPTENPREALEKVLNKEANFTYKCLVFGKVTEENLEKFMFATEGSAINPFVPWGYTYVDLDSDGVDELVIYPLSLTYCLILRYGGERVYGYLVPQRSFVNLRTDGTFLVSGGAGINSISSMSFLDTYQDTSFVIEDIAYKDDMDGVYFLNGKASDKETVEAYFENWDATTTNVSWGKLD